MKKTIKSLETKSVKTVKNVSTVKGGDGEIGCKALRGTWTYTP